MRSGLPSKGGSKKERSSNKLFWQLFVETQYICMDHVKYDQKVSWFVDVSWNVYHAWVAALGEAVKTLKCRRIMSAEWIIQALPRSNRYFMISFTKKEDANLILCATFRAYLRPPCLQHYYLSMLPIHLFSFWTHCNISPSMSLWVTTLVSLDVREHLTGK